jgi:hypothetical protein
MKKADKRLGEILTEKGLISQEQLAEALAEQKRTKDFLGTILIRKRFIDREKFLRALSDQFKIPYVDLKEGQADLGASEKFSSSVIIESRCCPVSQTDTQITVAITNPLDAMVLSKVEEEARPKTVKYILVDDEDMDALIKEYKKKLKNDINKLFS